MRDLTPLDDIDISDWAKENVYKMRRFNIMHGISESKFNPKASFTKEEAIVTLMRIQNMQNI